MCMLNLALVDWVPMQNIHNTYRNDKQSLPKEDFIHFCCTLVTNLVHNLIYQFLIYKRDA